MSTTDVIDAGAAAGEDAETTVEIVAEQNTTTTVPESPVTTPGDTTGEGVRIDIPNDLTAVAGSVVTVPVNIIDDASGLVTAAVRIRYDTTLLSTSLAQISAGDLWPGAYVRAAVTDEIGVVSIRLDSLDSVDDGMTGSVVEIEFDVAESANAGRSTTIDLEAVALNGGIMQLEEVPTLGDDSTDGFVTFEDPPSPPPGRIDVTLTSGETRVDASTGETASLPANLQWVHEWATFNVEVWVSIAAQGGGVLAGGSLALLYDTGFFSATGVDFGPAFVGQTQDINDDAGTVLIEGLATAPGIGVGRPTLLARVSFEATENDAGVALITDNQYLSEFPDLNLSVEAAHVDFVGQTAEDPVVGDMPATRVTPLVYDIDDDGDVTLGDAAALAWSFNRNVDDAVSPLIRAADFDMSGAVDLNDLSFFAANFGLSRSEAGSPMYSADLLSFWQSDRLRLANGDSTDPGNPAQKRASVVPAELTETQLGPVADAAVARFEPFLSADAAMVLDEVTFEIADLPGDVLGAAVGNTVQIDVDAAGLGWHVDATPADDAEFVVQGDAYLLVASSEGPAAGRVDLLTVVMHELGHVLGLDHTTGGIMADSLLLGTRRLPAGELAELLAEMEEVDEPAVPENGDAVDSAFAAL